MQNIHQSEQYTVRGHFALMTRTVVLKDAQLARIADHLRSNAEDLTDPSDLPTIDDYRVAGEMLGWAFNIAPIRIVARFDY